MRSRNSRGMPSLLGGIQGRSEGERWLRGASWTREESKGARRKNGRHQRCGSCRAAPSTIGKQAEGNDEDESDSRPGDPVHYNDASSGMSPGPLNTRQDYILSSIGTETESV